MHLFWMQLSLGACLKRLCYVINVHLIISIYREKISLDLIKIMFTQIENEHENIMKMGMKNSYIHK